MVHIVGAGPGAVDLITVRGKKLLEEADVIIYAGSLVNRELLETAKEGAEIYDSARMDLEQVMDVIEKSHKRGLDVVRLHTGDPSIYGAIREQMDAMDQLGIPYSVCPGVSSFCGAAAALEMEYTLPGITQSVIITRMAGRTPVPERESISHLASHGCAMAVFLSAGMTDQLSKALMEGGYEADTPAAIVYKATWPDEKVVRCTVSTLKEAADREQIHKTALILVGDCVAQTGYDRSKLYDPSFATEFRPGRELALGYGTEKEQPENKKAGTLFVVGMGPGNRSQITGQAYEMMERSQVIAGYTVYVDLVRQWFPEKEFLTTPMTKEEERCRRAFESCLEGKDTAMICSGDAGVYGMAGLILEMAQEYPGVKVEIAPGLTAACGGAALLGAPLMHDFAVISLSDRLTPVEQIWKRVEAAAMADFVICLYNPCSKGRPDYLRQACERILAFRKESTVCGLASRIGREGEKAQILTLGELARGKGEADMFTTVYIGNSQTRRMGSCMVTPRGYGYERKI